MQQSPNSSAEQHPCADILDLIPAYALGATNPEETLLVQRHLSHCPEAAEELRLYTEMSVTMMQDVPHYTAPAHLENSLLAAVRGDTLTASVAAPAITPEMPVVLPPIPRSAPHRAPGRAARRLWIAAALLLLTLSNIFWLARVTQLEAEQTTANQLILDLLNASDTQVITLASPVTNVAQGGAPAAAVLWNREEADAVLIASGLAPIEASRTYQLWIIPQDADPISAGVFDPQTGNRFVFARPTALEGVLVGITEEPAGGSPQPTSDPVLLSAL
ncbi:MAG: anti-sigma factor [Anaerolineae bacterium]